MKVEVFESCCCSKGGGLYESVLQAAGGNAGIEIVKFTDAMDAVKRGLMRTPAIVIDGRAVCAGRTPKSEEIVAWLAGGK